MILRHNFEPTDNNRLANLSGAFDAHLRAIEEARGVRISRREAAFPVECGRPHAACALALLEMLYERAARPIPPEALQLALVEANGTLALSGVQAEALPPGADGIVLHTRRSDLRGRTRNQVQYLHNILSHDITFGIGPAGTGKTYLAVASAVDALERSAVQRIVLTRPAVEAGEALGQQRAQIDERGIGARDVVGHHQRVIGQQAVATAVEHHRTPQWFLCRFQLANDLPYADRGILFRQHIGEIHFDGAQQMRECPGLTTRLIEHVVDLQPWGLDNFLINHRQLTDSAARIGIQAHPSDTGRESLRQ